MNRSATMVSKFLDPPCAMRKTPHRKIFTPRYLDIGNLAICADQLVGVVWGSVNVETHQEITWQLPCEPTKIKH